MGTGFSINHPLIMQHLLAGNKSHDFFVTKDVRNVGYIELRLIDKIGILGQKEFPNLVKLGNLKIKVGYKDSATFSLKNFPAENAGTVVAAIVMGSPV